MYKHFIYTLLLGVITIIAVGCDKETDTGHDIEPEKPERPVQERIGLSFYVPTQSGDPEQLVIQYIIESTDVKIVNYGYIDDKNDLEYYLLQYQDTTYLLNGNGNGVKLCKYDLFTGVADSLIYSVERQADDTYIRSCYSYNWGTGEGFFTRLDDGSLKSKSLLRDALDEDIKAIVGKHLDRLGDQIGLWTTLFPAKFSEAVGSVWKKAILAAKSSAGIEIDPVEETEEDFVDEGISYVASVCGFSTAYKMGKSAGYALKLIDKDTPPEEQQEEEERYREELYPVMSRLQQIPSRPSSLEDVYFLVSPQTLVFDSKGGSRGVSVISSYDWDIESVPSWCEIERGKETFFVDVKASSIERKGIIVVYSDMRKFELGIARTEIFVKQNSGFDNTTWNIVGNISSQVDISFSGNIPGAQLPPVNVKEEQPLSMELRFGDVLKNEVYIAPKMFDVTSCNINQHNSDEINVSMDYEIPVDLTPYGMPGKVVILKGEFSIFLFREADGRECSGRLSSVISGSSSVQGDGAIITVKIHSDSRGNIDAVLKR